MLVRIVSMNIRRVYHIQRSRQKNSNEVIAVTADPISKSELVNVQA